MISLNLEKWTMVDRKILKLGGKMDYEYDYEKLRSDLKDHYGTAMFAGFSAAMMDMSKIDKASDEELLRIAKKEKMNLCKYMR